MWYHIVAGQPQGPIDEAALDRLAAQGTINAETLVWKEGMAQWVPFNQARGGFAAPSSLPGLPSLTTCTVCGKSLAADDLVELAGQRVCAACKPEAVQRLREGVAPVSSFGGTAWRDKDRVVTRDNNALPSRCFKCNAAAASAPLKRKLSWHHPGLFILIFLGLLVYVILAAIVSRRATVDVYLCDHHLQLRKKFIIGAWLGAITGIVLVPVGASINEGWLCGVGVVLFFVAAIAGLRGGSVTRAGHIKDGVVWLRGAGKDFLASLPQWPG